MNKLVRIAWHFGGLIVATTGAAMLGGWPGAMIVIGAWAVAATMFDTAMGL